MEVCTPKTAGGLGIRPMRLMNNALLGKWLWRIENDTDSLWNRIITAKYGVKRDGCDIYGPPNQCSCLWKGITSIKTTFSDSIKYRVGSGNKILFRLDTLVGERSLADQFPDLYRCARDPQAKVGDYMERSSNQVFWGPIFRRNLIEFEERNFFSLLEILNQTLIPNDEVDCRIWTPSQNGEFSVSSFFLSLQPSSRAHNIWSYLWKTKAPPRHLTFV